MPERLSLKPPDSRFIEGLSYEPFVVKTARWLIDATYKVAYQPDPDNLFQYLDRVYGVGQDQATRALEIAQDRIMRELNNGKT